MRSLLEVHPNPFLSIKLDARSLQRTLPLALDRSIQPEWVALLRDFPDRFVIGNDQFCDEETGRLDGSWQFVDALPPDIAPLVTNANAKRIYHLGDKTR